jgi:uncharacterized protein (DUF1778 family)
MSWHRRCMDLKRRRLQIRVDPAARRRLEQAAEAAHLTVLAFVLQAAEQRAAEVLAERAVVTLSPEAAEVFAEALARPAMVNDRLAEALQRPRTFSWLE